MSGWGPPPPGYGPPPPQAIPPYPMNPMGPPPGYPLPPPNNNLAVASFVCGILAIVPGCCCGLFGLPLSILAVVLGLIGFNQINATGGQMGGKGLAIAGMVCGGTALFINVGGTLFHLTEHMTRSLHI